VRELVLSGASIDATGPGGNTALMLAIQQGHSDTTSVLLQHGADVNIYNDQGFTALIRAADRGYSEICDLLLHHGSQVDERVAGRITGQKRKRGPSTEQCALIVAASKGHFTTVRTLIAWGATIDIQDHAGHTPLYWASQHGRVASVLSLLQAGASTTLCSRKGVPAVAMAAQKNMAAILHIFFSHGCSPDLVSIIISIISYHIYLYSTVDHMYFIECISSYSVKGFSLFNI
jgi:ankyrin repeat protein